MNDGNRTHDSQSHNLVLYQLSYTHRKSLHQSTAYINAHQNDKRWHQSARCELLRFRLKAYVPWGIRTLDLLLRRQLLYPAELKVHKKSPKFGVKRVMGIEPTRPAWKAGILPLNYTRMCCSSNALL